MHQGDVVENRDAHFEQVFAGGEFKKIVILRAEYVGFADYRVCMTIRSFTSRMGAMTRGSNITISEDRRRNLT